MPSQTPSSQRPKRGVSPSQRNSKIDDEKRRRREKNRSSSESEDDGDGDVRKRKEECVVRFMIVSHQNEKGIQRSEITRNFFTGEHKTLFDDAMMEAIKKKMLHLFGYEILPQHVDGKVCYFLSNTLRPTKYLKEDEHESAIDGLLYSILANIFMRNPKDKKITGNAVFGFLSKLGVKMDAKHPVFGDVKKLIDKTFVERGWLQISQERLDDGEEGDLLYGWGWRSRLMLSRGYMLQFVSDALAEEKQNESDDGGNSQNRDPNGGSQNGPNGCSQNGNPGGISQNRIGRHVRNGNRRIQGDIALQRIRNGINGASQSQNGNPIGHEQRCESDWFEHYNIANQEDQAANSRKDK